MKQLEGKSVVVTGAGGGIGRDFALAMAAAGAKVLVNDIGTSVQGEGRDAGPAQQVVNLLMEQGGIAVASTDSVAEWESANRIVQAALDAFGRLDVVVNNAGILRDRFFFNMSVPPSSVSEECNRVAMGNRGRGNHTCAKAWANELRCRNIAEMHRSTM